MDALPLRFNYINPKEAEEDPSLVGEPNRLAGFLCLFGFFLHIILSDPLLNTLGFHYEGDEGKFYEKIHPGTYFILLSFFVLIWDRGNLFRRIYFIYKNQTPSFILLMIYILLVVYIQVRSGLTGMAFLIDTHFTFVICSIVLCYAPISYCRRAMHFFVVFAAINSMTGIAEGIGKFRIFTFDPDWPVLKEEYFRASAFLGHPLNNTTFTSVALFIVVSQRYPVLLKGFLICLYMMSLVAFGGRVGFVFSTLGMLAFGVITTKRWFLNHSKTMLQMFVVLGAIIAVPAGLGGVLLVALDSDMGTRLVQHAEWDDSADSRRQALQFANYMSREELIAGVSSETILQIEYRMSMGEAFDIENPWILMFMNLGAVAFAIWLLGTGWFAYNLMKGKNLALKMAILSYYIIASTSNSFGRKDSMYLIMVSAVICAARTLAVTKARPFEEPLAIEPLALETV